MHYHHNYQVLAKTAFKFQNTRIPSQHPASKKKEEINAQAYFEEIKIRS